MQASLRAIAAIMLLAATAHLPGTGATPLRGLTQSGALAGLFAAFGNPPQTQTQTPTQQAGALPPKDPTAIIKRYDVGPLCNGNPITLTCGVGGFIIGASAFWGRSDSTTCPYSDTNAMQNTGCSLLTASTEVLSQCLNKNSCTVTFSSDPCFGTYKWSAATFYCSEPLTVPTAPLPTVPLPTLPVTPIVVVPTVPSATQPSGTTPTGTNQATAPGLPAPVVPQLYNVGPFCDGNPLTLTCGNGGRIVAATAFWGRSDSTTCPYPDPKAMQYTSCSLNTATTEVAANCISKNSCTTTFSADPCVGTYKWSSATFTCA